MAAGLLLGCAVDSDEPVAGEIDIRTLDVGPYSVTRRVYDQAAGAQGVIVEAARMTAAVAPTVRIDPSLSIGRSGDHQVIVDVDEVVPRPGLTDASKSVLERSRLVMGYAAGGSDTELAGENEPPSATTISTTLLRYPDTGTADLVAAELGNAEFAAAGDRNRTLTLPEYPTAHIHWQPGVPAVGIFLAHKEFVLVVSVRRPRAEESDLLDWARKALDVQVPTLDRFRPTPESEFANLKVDPDGLLARTVTRYPDNRRPNVETFTVHSPNRLVNGDSNQGRRLRVFDDAGVEVVALMDTDLLYPARDPQAARTLLAVLVDRRSEDYLIVDGPSGVPDVRCMSLRDQANPGDFHLAKCYVVHGRYVATLNGKDLADLRQRAAAQYALLVNSL